MWTPDPSDIITPEQKAAEEATAARLVAFPNLEPDRFWFGLRVSGYEDNVRDWVARLNEPEIEVGGELVANPGYDPVAWASASAKLEFATFFERDHPLILAAQQAIGLTDAELDALWQFAAT